MLGLGQDVPVLRTGTQHWSKSMLSDTYRIPDMCQITTRYLYYKHYFHAYRVVDMYAMYAENRAHILYISHVFNIHIG